MHNQDFEQYANLKQFNYSIAETWRDAFTEALIGQPEPAEKIKLLDYGCGDGKYFSFFLGNGLIPENVHGIEVSQTRVERCHQLGWTKAVHIEQGKTALPYQDDLFDMINFMEVIEHIPETTISAILAELVRVLKPTGQMLISTPNYPVKRFYDITDAVFHRKWSRLRDDPTHVTCYDHFKLTKLLGCYFNQIEERDFKLGFLYRRYRHPKFKHKLFFVCGQKREL